MMDTLIFLINRADESGYNAKAEIESIFTQGETIDKLKLNISDALECHFGDEKSCKFELRFV